MAYATRYRVKYASQDGNEWQLLIDEDGASSIIDLDGTEINLQYIPQGDDPFEPIYASQIQAGIDVTDDLANAPDFTSLDDRKYHARLMRGSDMIWQGFVLSDNVQMDFNTGRKIMVFNAICGLGMLEDINLPAPGTAYRYTILTYILNAINGVAFPTPANVRLLCDIFATGLTDSDGDTPFTQTYLSYNNFYDTGNNEWFDCLQVLRDILKSWGCRIFMYNGEWNIVQVNQMANASRRWVRFDSTGVRLGFGTDTDLINVPTDAIFIGGDQLKIYTKGFNNFLSDKSIEYPDNAIFNANLKQYTGDTAVGWTTTTSGTGLVKIRANQEKEINAWILALGNVPGTALAEASTVVPIQVTAGDIVSVQFRVYMTIEGVNPNCRIKLTVDNGVVTYYLSDNNEWKAVTIPVTDYYAVEEKANDTLVNLEEIPACPISGQLYFAFFLDGTTEDAFICGDFQIDFKDPAFVGVKLEAKINDTETYRKEVTFPHGYNNELLNQAPSHLGAITDVDGQQFTGWYMLEREGVESFAMLAQLMFKNYINMFRKNIINIDATIEGPLGADTPLEFTDTDPAQISVQDKRYLVGSGSYNPITYEFEGTHLEVSNTNQEVTINTTYDNGIDPGIAFDVAGAGINSPAACALGTYTLVKYSTQFLPVVGDVVYNEATLQTTFNGGNLYYKFNIIYFNTVRSYRISSAGVITESNTC